MKRRLLRTGGEVMVLLSLALVIAGVCRASGWRVAAPPHALGLASAPALDVFSVSTEDVAVWKEKVIWVDARPLEAYHAKHLPGALHLTEEAWETGLLALLEDVLPDDRVVVYCGSKSCDTSRAVAQRLRRDLAMEDVYALIGGWDALKSEGALR